MPTVDVIMSNVTVLPAAGQATLFIGATGPGETVITVIATDSTGAVSKQLFPVRAVADTVNDPPVMLPTSPIYGNVGTRPQLLAKAVDLEFDYLLYGIAAAGGGTNPNSFGDASIASTYTPRDTAGRQTLALGVTAFNDERRFASASSFNAFAPFDAYNFQVVELAFGDKPVRPAVETVKGAPGVALTDAIVGRVSDLDAAAAAATLTVTINWGDGSAASTGTLSRDTSAPGAASYIIRGTHTYGQPGIYAVLVKVAGDKGATAFMRSTAVISAAPLVAWGTFSEATGATLSNRIVAHFTDSDPSRRVADYVATIDWGDGLLTRGTVVRAPTGAYLVRGTHSYRDSQSYAIGVRIHKKGTLPAADAIAWSSAQLRFTSAPYLPPFPQVHLVAAWNSGPGKTITNPITTTFSPADLKVQFSGNFAVVNSGNRALANGKIRYWLSNDAKLDAKGPGADTPLMVNGVPELIITGLAAGGSGAGNFTIPLPQGQSGGGKYLLSELVYSDPIADNSAVDKVVVSGPIDPTVVVFNRVSSVNPSSNQTSEGGGTVTFQVALDTAPTADVKIPVESSLTTEGTVAPAEIIFTPANWSIPQTVVVTGADDATKDGNKSYKVTLKSPVSTDSNYTGLPAKEINLVNVDND
jgi:hypothetical protein